jgi:hypothetical protein
VGCWFILERTDCFDEEPNLYGFDLDFPMLCEPLALGRRQRDMMPHLRSHPIKPRLSLSAPAISPLQQPAIGRKLNSCTGPGYPEAMRAGELFQAHSHAGGTAVCYQ